MINKNKIVQAHLLCHLCVPCTGWYSQPNTVAVSMTFHKKVDIGKIRTT